MLSNLSIIRFSDKYSSSWDEFIKSSSNGTFIHTRKFLNYHLNKFDDHSLIIKDKKKIICLFIANQSKQIIYSHEGLTFGGLIIKRNLKSEYVLVLFQKILDYYKNKKINKIIYKCVPFIFHKKIIQSDLYALFRMKAKLIRRDLSSFVNLNEKYEFSDLRIRGIKKANRNNIKVTKNFEITDFYNLLKDVLSSRHNVSPVHKLDELVLLHNLFPNNILLRKIYNEDVLNGGLLLFVYDHTIHFQYITVSDIAKNNGSLDYLILSVFDEFKSTHNYASLGISTENNGKVLNTGLIRQKEGFGSSSLTLDHYELNF